MNNPLATSFTAPSPPLQPASLLQELHINLSLTVSRAAKRQCYCEPPVERLASQLVINLG